MNTRNETVDRETGEVMGLEPTVTAIMTRDEAQERALLDVQVTTAKNYPRKMPLVRTRILSLATVDEDTATACFYGLKPGADGQLFQRGGKRIIGESVRLAEIVASSYGNMRLQSEVVRVDDDTVTCRARCWDLEANYAVEAEVVRRILVGRPSGDSYKDRQKREDAVALASMSGQAIARRTAVFNTVPPAALYSVFQAIKDAALGNAATLGERRARALEYLTKAGVSMVAVLAALGKDPKAKAEDIDLEDLLVLRGWMQAVKDGTATLAELFSTATSTAAGAEAAAKSAGSTPQTAQVTTPKVDAPTATPEATTPAETAKGKRGRAPTPPATGMNVQPSTTPTPTTAPTVETPTTQAPAGNVSEGAV